MLMFDTYPKADSPAPLSESIYEKEVIGGSLKFKRKEMNQTQTTALPKLFTGMDEQQKLDRITGKISFSVDMLPGF